MGFFSTPRRRDFLAWGAAAVLRAESYRIQPTRLEDKATELELFRVSDPAYPSWMTAPNLRSMARRGRWLLFSADRGSGKQALWTDWRTGETKEMARLESLDPATLALTAGDRGFCCFDGPSLRAIATQGPHSHEIARVSDGWTRGAGFSLSIDGLTAVWVELRGDRSRLRMSPTAKGAPTTIIEVTGEIRDPQLRPARAQILYRIGDALWLINLDGQQNRALKIATDGNTGQFLWSPLGKTFLYLANPADPRQLTSLREHTPDENADRALAKTSQFGSFGINGDASVFVGASRSKASPYVLLLLRVAHRELTLCEHRASNPSVVNPAFSPDSQTIFFNSDREGKPAIYRMHVEKFVEETGDESG